MLELAAHAQTRSNIESAEHDNSRSDPVPKNKVLSELNPDPNMPPPTDHGSVIPIWYSFSLTEKRIQEGGWTHEVTQRELPPSKDIAGVNMRLTAGSYRELHWHTADEWAYMLYGKARVTVMKPDGTMFIDDVSEGDIWLFPRGFPHSIQGLDPDGCEFLLIFNDGMFTESGTFLLSDWVAHTPPEVLAKNLKLDKNALAKFPKSGLYIFPGRVPGPLEETRQRAGAKSTAEQYTFKLRSMAPARVTSMGSARIVDSRNFPVSKSIAAALINIKPGGMRELHWHPNASEWQYYISGKARMTVFAAVGNARTADFIAGDVGYVPVVAGHHIENTGDKDVWFLEIFASDKFEDVSLNNWLRRLPEEMVTADLNIDADEIKKIPSEKMVVL
jgi:oxalate decarboxylase